MRGSIGVLAVTFLLLSACATVPPPLRGDFADVNTIDASTGAFDGTPVRWGGVVADIRMTDNGECAEIGWYPLDRFTSRPVLGPVVGGAYGNSNVNKPVFPATMIGVARYIAAPRFLACSKMIRDHNTYFPGAVVAVVGTIAPAKIYQVNYTDCVRPGSMKQKAVYSGTTYTTNDTECVVSLPALNVAAIYAWPMPFDPSPPFNVAAGQLWPR